MDTSNKIINAFQDDMFINALQHYWKWNRKRPREPKIALRSYRYTRASLGPHLRSTNRYLTEPPRKIQNILNVKGYDEDVDQKLEVTLANEEPVEAIGKGLPQYAMRQLLAMPHFIFIFPVSVN